MNFIRRLLLVLVSGIILSACGVVPRNVRPAAGASGHSSAPSPIMSVSKHNEVRASLEQAYRDWKGTPYVLGGATKRGVDCSSFVRIVFDRYFGIKVPPNTRTQLNAGTGIRRSALRTGDLVFFRTGRKTLHVGIIVEGQKFLHASTSQGVMISNLRQHYWSSRYLAARRVM